MNPGKTVTREQAEAMQDKAVEFLDRIDSDDPNDIAGMSVEEYAEHKHLQLSNPGATTLAEYTTAVVEHERDQHDAGGAIIHQTPRALRSAFAKEIWRRRRKHGTDKST